jgi:hypothetical protein
MMNMSPTLADATLPQDLFPCGLAIETLHCAAPRTRKEEGEARRAAGGGGEERRSLESGGGPVLFTSCATITIVCRPVKTNTVLDNINAAFNKVFCSSGDTRPSEPRVRFSEDVEVFKEPEELAEDLAEARVSNFEQRKADLQRMERLLSPVLSSAHRQRMFSKIYGGESNM